ncbi:MAG: hypothetical protein L0Y72_22265 [Gemmataceae bacterium]|nr:hypothetical protein [Gemmataceae bacterium]MCI0741767.1 hypothetical protein [Gemmataceae bacterium]
MSAVQEKAAGKPLLPPDEKFWQRYSPHHEFPLAGVTSLCLHGLAIVLLILAGVWQLFQWNSPAHRPPSLDVVQIEGGGDGFEGGAGGDPGPSGEPSPTEIAHELKKSPVPEEIDPVKKPLELDIPEIVITNTKDELDAALAKLGKEAEDQAKPKPIKTPTAPSKGSQKGASGQGGVGSGTGKGTKGFGPGVGGPGGRKLTKAEVYAIRWHFNLSGTPKEHVEKLIAIGVTVAVPQPRSGWAFIPDLRRRPVELQAGNLDKYKDAVKWQNTDPISMQGLTHELKLPFVPPAVLMLLPKDREERMAAEELHFAQQVGRPPEQIRKTVFDFRLKGGVFEPVVIDQN